jgi:uncharacterized membrane protein YedE/YeeE
MYTGLIVGLLFGFVLQRGRFCMNSAFRDIILLQEYTLLKAVGIAILVQMVGFTILAMTDVIALNPNPLLGIANIVGSFVFGVGMVLAGGCASGVTYRVGEGMVGAMTAVLGLAAGALMTSTGAFVPLKDELLAHQPDFTAKVDDLVLPGNHGFTVANVVEVPHEVAAFGIAIIVALAWSYFAWKHREEEDDEGGESRSLVDRIFRHGWHWFPTGVVIGLVGMLAFWLSSEAGRAYPLGITGGYNNIFKKLFGVGSFPEFNWFGMLILGTILGALLAAFVGRELKLRAPSPGTLIITFVGGLLMGFGAVASGGCNIGHILSGVPQLSLGSILAGAFIVIGAWVASYLIFVLPQRM